jgi:hypothetical protein
MKIGSLYQFKKYFWVLYPSKETIVHPKEIAVSITTAAFAAAELASWWSKVLDRKVSYVTEKSLFVLLEQDNLSCKILTADGNIGWVAYSESKDAEWCKGCIKEINPCKEG